jgi:transposase
MEQEAREAEKNGRIKVIVQDNGPIHRCKEVQQLWSKWESPEMLNVVTKLYIFKYSSIIKGKNVNIS